MPVQPVPARSASSPVPAARTPLREGARGSPVMQLQEALQAHGFNPGPADGRFGDQTRRALVGFQRARGLEVDGVAGPRTWAALRQPPQPERRQAPKLSPGAEGPKVAELQRQLQRQGFSPGGVDGIYGPSTRGAVVAFQAAHGIARDGVCGPQTWAVLQGGALPAPPAGASGPRTGNAFIDGISAGARAGAQRYGIPASVSIAQSILESGWGRSDLARRANNLFGMKGEGPAGSLTVETREFIQGRERWVRAAFQKFHSQAEAVAEHARLLGTSPYYARARAVASDARAFAHALTGVYATAPNYGQMLVQLMDEQDLYRFDRS